MKGLLVRLYVLVSVLFFLGITVFFFARLSQTRQENEARAGQAFRQLAETVAASWQTTPLPEAGELLADILTRPDTVQPLVVSVYSFDIGIDYLWAIDDRFINRQAGSNIDTSAGPPVISSNEFVHRQFSRSFRLPDGGRRIVTAVYPVLDNRALFPTLRLTLILVLGFLSVTLVVVLFGIVREATATQQRRVGNRADTGAPPPSSPIAGQHQPDAPAVQPGVIEPSESGLMPESALPRRLTMELERAGFQEQDVSVAMFRFSAGSRGDEMYAQNAHAILQFFSFEDLCFEYADREVVVIFPGTTLSDALGQLERFQRFYWEERHNWNAPDADLAIGVSARNGRLVEGGRVLGECRTARKRAEKSSGRIMGFQPDPQRYRAELLNQSR